VEFEYPERHRFGLGVPAEEFTARLRQLQAYLKEIGIAEADVWGSSSEPGDIAYLSNHFPPPGEAAWLQVPAEGDAVLYADTHRPDLVMVGTVRPLSEKPPSSGAAVPGELAAMRQIKSPAELALLAGAATIAAVGLEAGLATVIAGATERHVAAAAIAAAISAGADECRCAVRSGPWAGLARTGEPVVIEIRGACQGYRVQEARTIKVGDAAPVHELELALQRMLAQLKAGTSFKTAWDHAARRMAEHGCSAPADLAWGIGLSEGELPFVNVHQEGRLLDGQVVVLNVTAESGLLRRMVAIGNSGAQVIGQLAV
jgi:Xaa-Pro aminopeptidase